MKFVFSRYSVSEKQKVAIELGFVLMAVNFNDYIGKINNNYLKDKNLRNQHFQFVSQVFYI